MKYSDFEKKVKELGYYYEKSDSYHIVKNSQGFQLAYVSRFVQYSMGTAEHSFKHLDSIVSRNIIEICYNLASTPLEEREEERRFKLKMEGLSEGYNYFTSNNIDRILCFDTQYNNSGVKTVFTENEITHLPENIQKAIELGIITKIEIIEVD